MSDEPKQFDIVAEAAAIIAASGGLHEAPEGTPTGTGIYLATAHAVRDVAPNAAGEAQEEIMATYSLFQGSTVAVLRQMVGSSLAERFPEAEGWRIYVGLHELPWAVVRFLVAIINRLYEQQAPSDLPE